MPALFAYLFSLLIFIGGGYAGLVWLTEPAVKTDKPPMAMVDATTRPHPHHGRLKALHPSASDAGTANLGAPSTPEAEPSTPEAETTATAESTSANATSSDDAGSGMTAKASAMAAGADSSSATSGGTEQEKQEKEGSPIKDAQKSDSAALPNRDVPAQNGMPAKAEVLAKANGIGSQEGQPRSETTATGNVLSENPPGKPLSPAANARIAAASSDSASRGKTVTGSAHRAQKEAKRNSKPRDRDDDSRKTFQQASRSKLVMMTLQTIEFPDGHRQERLVPLRHSWAEDE